MSVLQFLALHRDGIGALALRVTDPANFGRCLRDEPKNVSVGGEDYYCFMLVRNLFTSFLET